MPVNGKQDAKNAVAVKPLSVIGGAFTCSLSDAAKITSHIDLSSVPAGITLEAIGYLTEDGPKRTVSNEAETIKAWGGDTLLNTYKGAEATVEIPAAEYLNPVGHRMVYGSENVTYEPGPPAKLTINGKLNSIPPHVGIVLVVDTDSATGTIVYGDAQAVLDGDIEMNGKDLTSNPLKFNLRPVDGAFFREYWVRKAS